MLAIQEECRFVWQRVIGQRVIEQRSSLALLVLAAMAMISPAEMPECPVCLSSYEGEGTIPRVLPCGHTACESCLVNLPQKYPLTIRCPACTQLVKYPSHQGPSSLPKNIDLLRLIAPTTIEKPRKKQSQGDPVQAYSGKGVDFGSAVEACLWSDEFYQTWKNWVLPPDAVSSGEREKLSLFRVAGSELLLDGGNIKVSYVARIMNFLSGMREEEKEELGLILRFCSKGQYRVCKVCGLWGDLGDGFLYLVSERPSGSSSGELLSCFECGVSKGDDFVGFGMMGMEMCEAVIGLHLEGLTVGCLRPFCFELDGFGHVNLNLTEVLVAGRGVSEAFLKTDCGERRIGVKEMGRLIGQFLKSEVLVSPEVLFEVVRKEGVVVAGMINARSVGQKSDVWSLACVLLRFLIGKQFTEELIDYVEQFVSETSEENDLDFSGLYMGLMVKVSFLLERKYGEEYESLQQILCRCLNPDPKSRPFVIDVWKCIRDLIISGQFVNMVRLDGDLYQGNDGHCLVLGEVCRVLEERLEVNDNNELQGADNSGGENQDYGEEEKVEKHVVEGLLGGKVKSKELQGHLNCVTGLAIGGGFLFSSSYDKLVHVWSLQDFSLVHTFKGHEHKVMSVIYVDEEQPVCISGDSGGGIFIWSLSNPLGQGPLKNWHEEQDWRYSGIHALTTDGNGYLYTGSGDRSIKAWSLQDCTLSCTMEGHKNVVSTLAACDGILYSGSWDGTIRLWSLSDHSHLTTLGEDMPGPVTSVLSLFAYRNMLVASHENGLIKVWRNDVLVKSWKPHTGAIFAIGMEGRWLLTGGWDKMINIQELSGDEFQGDIRHIGSIPCESVVTALLCWKGKLFVGHGDRTLKVHYLQKVIKLSAGGDLAQHSCSWHKVLVVLPNAAGTNYP